MHGSFLQLDVAEALPIGNSLIYAKGFKSELFYVLILTCCISVIARAVPGMSGETMENAGACGAYSCGTCGTPYDTHGRVVR